MNRDPIINSVHAPTKVNAGTKYEQDTLNIVGSRVATWTGRTGQTGGAGHNTQRPKWAKGKNQALFKRAFKFKHFSRSMQTLC